MCTGTETLKSNQFSSATATISLSGGNKDFSDEDMPDKVAHGSGYFILLKTLQLLILS